MKHYDALSKMPRNASNANNLTLTALGAVYQGDNPRHFEQALESVLGQTRPAEEIVLVIDGPIPSALEAIVQNHAEALKIVRQCLGLKFRYRWHGRGRRRNITGNNLLTNSSKSSKSS